MYTWLRYGMIVLAALAVMGLQSAAFAEQAWDSDPAVGLDDEDPPAKSKDKAKKQPKAKAPKKAKAAKKKKPVEEPSEDDAPDDEEY